MKTYFSIMSILYYLLFIINFLYIDEKIPKMWRDTDLLWAKTTKEGLVHASVLQKKFEEEAQKILEDQQRMIRLAQAAAAAGSTSMTAFENKQNCRYFKNQELPYKKEKLADDETVDEKIINTKSVGLSPFSFSRMRRMDDKRLFHHHEQDKSLKILKTEDKYTTVDDFDDSLIEEDSLAAINARITISGQSSPILLFCFIYCKLVINV